MFFSRVLVSDSEYVEYPSHCAGSLGLAGFLPQVQYFLSLLKIWSCSSQSAPTSLGGAVFLEVVVLVGWAYTLRVVWAGW